MAPRRILRLWAPLAASWMLMAAELPMLTAVVARMADPEVHLAAYGSIVFPIALVIEGPIIMLLAASTALCTDWESYRTVRRFMLAAGATLTALHVLVAFTPLYDLLVVDLMAALPEVVEPGRVGLRIMTPWTWAIAYRRFQQGVLIRNEQSQPVTVGTSIRLAAAACVLGLGYWSGAFPGIVVGASAIATAVVAEAVYIGARVQPVLRERVRPAPRAPEPLTASGFLRFYAPLAMTPLITLVIQPAGAAAMNRMPAALLSVAAWPAVHGLVFITRSVGFAYNEVVVTLIGEEGAVPALRRFNLALSSCTVGLLLLVAGTPLSELWFEGALGLAPELARVCRIGVALAAVMPGYQVLQSWYQGALVRRRSTRPITEAVALYSLLSVGLLYVGTRWQQVTGIHYAVVSFVLAGVAQTTWLRLRSRAAIRAFAAQGAAGGPTADPPR